MSQIHTMRFSELIHPLSCLIWFWNRNFDPIKIYIYIWHAWAFLLSEVEYTMRNRIEKISFSSKQHENLPMSQFSSDRTKQWTSQKAVVVGCLIFSINIGHGMAIIPYNATRSSHSSWTLAQTIRIKIFALHSWDYTSNSCQSGNSLSPHVQERTGNRHQISARVNHCCLPQHPHSPEAFMSAFVVQHLRHQRIHYCLLEITKKLHYQSFTVSLSQS